MEGFFPPAITAGKHDQKVAEESAMTQMVSTRGYRRVGISYWALYKNQLKWVFCLFPRDRAMPS